MRVGGEGGFLSMSASFLLYLVAWVGGLRAGGWFSDHLQDQGFKPETNNPNQ